MTSGNCDPQTVTGEPDPWSRRNNIRGKRGKSGINSTRTVRLTAGEALLTTDASVVLCFLRTIRNCVCVWKAHIHESLFL